MRILLVGSSGGHLAQLYALKSWWSEHETLWVTKETVDATSLLAHEAVLFGHFPTTRNAKNLARNFGQARKVLADFQPNLIMSTGAGLAVPYYWLAKRAGARTAYLEVIDRIDSPTLTGKLVYPFVDEFLVQWPEQQAHYPGATLVGPVI